ncbi:peptidoglycan-binding protein [Streptomyces sp. HYC2]|uniref:efflux RND transporter periplasmic adaptor subunit n=1 Tax=Streptomyces sp. HYC2 TaxID=2955207 RepID=UPI0024813D28|nr:peptidoglycan-binding protein [Streptomyces sp. HYC2]
MAGLLGAGAVSVYAYNTTRSPGTAKENLHVNTAPIERGTLTGTTKASGTLAFAVARDVTSGLGGVVTSLPATGKQIHLGQRLFALDNVPVFLFRGTVPAWRAFQNGMDDGPDVKQLERSLATLGYFDGEPDEKFTLRTANAIWAWQKATGQKRTGTIELGRIVFAAGDVRVAAVKTTAGTQIGAGSPVLGITGLDKKVDVDLKLADQQLAVVGGKVTIDLPSGESTRGTITAVGVPTEKEGSNGKTVVIPVVVSLADPAAAGPLQQATVTVNFPSAVRKNVLSVPVGALQALDGDRFGVEVVGKDGMTQRVPVKTGLFAGGRVEISGDGIADGQEVVVPGV